MNALPPNPSPSVAHFPAARVAPNVRHAFGGIWRLTVCRFLAPRHWIVLAGLLVVLVLFSIPTSPNREAAAHGFLPWVVGFYLTFLVPILAFLTAGGAMRDETKGGTVDYVLTRPVGRPVFVLFKFLSHLACAQLDFLGAFAVVLGIGAYWEVPGLWTAAPLLLVAQLSVITAFSAFGFLGAVLTARYVLVGLVYGGVIEIGLGKIPTQLNRLSMTQQVRTMLEPITRVAGAETVAAEPNVLLTVGILLAFAATILAVTATVFAAQELASSPSREL